MREFTFRLDGGDRNVGIAYVPEAANGSGPVLVYCHGYAGSKKLSPFTTELLLRAEEAGLAVVLFDLFGCGETGGSLDDMTYGRWAQNTSDVVDYVATQPWADAARIGAVGVSSGSLAALRAALDTGRLAFVASIATCITVHVGMPADSPTRVLAEELETLVAGGRATYFGADVPLDFYRDYILEAPVYRLGEIGCPVLFLQGAEDNIWRRSDAWIGHQLLLRAGKETRHREIEGGDHNLDSGRQEALGELIDWLRQIGISGQTC